MTVPTFDVAIVSDFSQETNVRFETMTLLFLASWLEFANRSLDLPLHIACIGQPPHTVMQLAERCNARITVHEPMFFGGFANKLRGFEVDRQTDHLLLLDSDMLVLGEIQQLLPLLGENCISAAATNGPSIVPSHVWPKIFQLLDMPTPDYDVIPLNIELDTYQSEEYRDRTDFPPYYNGGIVFAPWESQLGDVWCNHLERIRPLTQRKARRSNQPSLATAITYLRQQGTDFELLPPAFHTRWQHLASGVLRTDQSRLMHTIGFGRWSNREDTNSALENINLYLSNTLSMTMRLREHQSTTERERYMQSIESKIEECHRVHQIMQNLYQKYIIA
ncbi:MAG: hypothetical protein JKX81_07300 [Arenicella sp.]|nr:hypothetical protein [Arenicella sp.]